MAGTGGPTVARVGALPIIDAFLVRCGIDGLLADYVASDARMTVPAGVALGVLIRNLCVAREPLYGLGRWAGGHVPGPLGLESGWSTALNDDKVGRSLDRLFDADRASMLSALMARVIDRFDLDLDELHNDSTSIKLSGAYATADGSRHRGKPTPAVRHGHSKDHRPDLKQLVWILTVSADGAVPVCFRLADGNTADDPTHVPTWEQLCRLAGRSDFLYVADCKLASRAAMEHIDTLGGRFLTVLPKTRREDGAFRTWLTTHEATWAEVARHRGRRTDEPEEVWWTTEAPWPSAEGFRVLWLRSSSKIVRDAEHRAQQIRGGIDGIERLAARLASPRCKLTTRAQVEEALSEVLAAAGAARFIDATVTETTEVSHRQARRGRPGKNTDYRRIETTRFSVTATIRDDVVRNEAASDGCWPLVTNDRDLSAAELFASYRWQPNLECRHRLLKGPLHVAPVWLNSPSRIEAFGFCAYVALLVHALVERQLRRAMACDGLDALPLYPEDRDCTAPTATKVFDAFADAFLVTFDRGSGQVDEFAPDLTPLQRHLLDLVGVPISDYEPDRLTRSTSKLP